MAPRVGQNLGGLRTIEDVRQRSVIDEETGCWHVRSKRHKGSVQVWLPAEGRVVSLAYALGVLMTGKPLPAGRFMAPTCLNTNCGNPKHRVDASRSEAMRMLRPKLDAQHRAKIAAGRRRNVIPINVIEAVLSSEERGIDLAARYGISPQKVSDIRRGRTRRALGVFSGLAA